MAKKRTQRRDVMFSDELYWNLFLYFRLITLMRKSRNGTHPGFTKKITGLCNYWIMLILSGNWCTMFSGLKNQKVKKPCEYCACTRAFVHIYSKRIFGDKSKHPQIFGLRYFLILPLFSYVLHWLTRFCGFVNSADNASVYRWIKELNNLSSLERLSYFQTMIRLWLLRKLSILCCELDIMFGE